MRINVIPPVELLDQHLMAEIREIKMLPKTLARSLKSKNGVSLDKLPQGYTMGAGHGKFFYDKLEFIVARFSELLEEAKKRGFSLSEKTMFLFDSNYDYSEILFNSKFWCNYVVDAAALLANRERISLRVSEKPGFYRFYGKLI